MQKRAFSICEYLVDMVDGAKNGGQTGLGLVNWSCGGCLPCPPQFSLSLIIPNVQVMKMNEMEYELAVACTKFWNRNAVNAPAPASVDYWAEANMLLPFQISGMPKFRFSYLIDADPNDKITFQFEGEDAVTFQMHSASWLWSIDYLLHRYLTLALRGSEESTKMLKVPLGILNRYSNYKNAMSSRKKELSSHASNYLKGLKSTILRYEADGYLQCKVPRFFEPCNLNRYCQELFVRPDNNAYLNSPRRDGILFQDEELTALPAFELEDYVAHELRTGISLSTEITAIVLELDEAIRDIVLNEFFKSSLRDIVRFPFPFARVAAARNYFQQIISEWTRDKYSWNTMDIDKRTMSILSDYFPRARMHVDTLLNTPLQPEALQFFTPAVQSEEELQEILQAANTQKNDPLIPRKYKITKHPHSEEIMRIDQYLQPFLPEFPTTKDPAQMDIYMEQIKAYLRVVIFPLDWASIEEHRPDNLAIFTNRNHKHIPLLLNYLETGKQIKNLEDDRFPTKASICIDLYHAIHQKVRSESQDIYDDLSLVKDYPDHD